MIKKGDARIGHTPIKSIPGHLEKPSSSLSQLYAKLRYFSYRFLHEATNSISCRFLCEATGPMIYQNEEAPAQTGPIYLRPTLLLKDSRISRPF